MTEHQAKLDALADKYLTFRREYLVKQYKLDQFYCAILELETQRDALRAEADKVCKAMLEAKKEWKAAIVADLPNNLQIQL